jgi:glycolate oxidase FAD binding subunit
MTLATELAETIAAASCKGTPLAISGGGSKAFYGREVIGTALDVRGYRGVVAYEPTELVVTVRAGTPLRELTELLATQRQMLAFEPPAFGAGATVGGMVACGLAGPRRPYVGAVRDFVLGVVCINGRGQILRFGGQVMKNVAGFDVSRLMVGALGSLGVLLEVSFKVLPVPAAELTLVQELPLVESLRLCNAWAGQPLPLSATCYSEGKLYVRLSGAESAVAQAAPVIGGDPLADAADFWRALREHELAFFRRSEPLWRIVVPAAALPMRLTGDWLIDWGGSQRWLYSDATMDHVQNAVRILGGHASLFRGGDRAAGIFMPLPGPLLELHRRVKAAFDPAGILNRRRMYAEL